MEDASCAAASACIAVGNYTNAAGNAYGPLAEQWDGIGWAILPNPQGQYMTGVSCISATACTAVGPGAYGWNGSAWSIQPTPSKGNDGSFLNHVSCKAANDCTAVGTYRVYQQHFVYTFTLAERWNGTTWSIQSTSNPDRYSSQLDAVSCTSANACTAVGSGINATLAERWDGTAWSIQTTPQPPGAAGETVLTNVSCAAAMACTAVGFYTNASGVYVALAERWNGSAWAIDPTPIPSAAGDTVLEGVSCTAADACIAVGWYSGGALVEEWNGTRWSIQSTPNPTGATLSILSGVSCRTATTCTAVGRYTTASGSQVTLAERYTATILPSAR